MHNRRARPTLRVLSGDLTSDWSSPHPQRSLAEGRHADLHPLSELPHPIIAKAAECFPNDASNDNFVGPVLGATNLRLLEVKNSQWRGGVWEDDGTGVCWLVVAGLAKGGHEDHDDFYKRVQRENDSGGFTSWLPTEDDVKLLERETAARILTNWELAIQLLATDALRSVQSGGTTDFTIDHPNPSMGRLAEVTLSITTVRESGMDRDEVFVEITPTPKFVASDLTWQMVTHILISVDPPEQTWDRYKDTYSTIGEIGCWAARVTALEEHNSRGTLAESVPGSTSHYSHKKHLADSTIDGTALRALCGAFFVPSRDHEVLPRCPTCNRRLAEFPQ